MALANTPGYGTTLSYAATDYSGPTVIGALIMLDPPEKSTDPVDTSSFGSSGHAKTYQPGWLKLSPAKFGINYDHTVINALEGFHTAGTMKGWIFTFNDGTVIGGATASTRK